MKLGANICIMKTERLRLQIGALGGDDENFFTAGGVKEIITGENLWVV